MFAGPVTVSGKGGLRFELEGFNVNIYVDIRPTPATSASGLTQTIAFQFCLVESLVRWVDFGPRRC